MANSLCKWSLNTAQPEAPLTPRGPARKATDGRKGRQVPAPHLALIGYGTADSLQLTVEAQRLLARLANLPAELAVGSGLSEAPAP